jgi:hypothetical protein
VRYKKRVLARKHSTQAVEHSRDSIPRGGAIVAILTRFLAKEESRLAALKHEADQAELMARVPNHKPFHLPFPGSRR